MPFYKPITPYYIKDNMPIYSALCRFIFLNILLCACVMDVFTIQGVQYLVQVPHH
nr:MAG TPA: hypothetical protein [Bacteriophage sp.]